MIRPHQPAELPEMFKKLATLAAALVALAAHTFRDNAAESLSTRMSLLFGHLHGLITGERLLAVGTYHANCVRPDGTLRWEEDFPNTVTTVGKNYLLDNGMAGSSFTAAFYLGLISSVSYSAISAADTMASHAGWTEAGIANAPTYSQSTRPAAAWSSASAGAKALSAALAFSITSTGTLKGAFLTTVSTKDGTTGTLFSAGLFTGGDKVVANADTVNVSYSLSV
jgi:hypothetical protein